jgi:hypothetical protein
MIIQGQLEHKTRTETKQKKRKGDKNNQIVGETESSHRE